MAEGGMTTLTDAIVNLREDDKIITDDLLHYEKEFVISIVGMPGVGKTTLASTLYNTHSVADHFDIRAWCTVSQSYQIRALLLSILDQVNASDQVSNMDDQDLADHLCRKLKGRRFLIVLDDVWDTGLWNGLRTYLPKRKGNRILITTRDRDVAVQIGSKVNELHGLSKESSLKLFKKKMLEVESLSDNLMSISEGILEDCKGLPLSIVIIAGILSNIERTEKRWKQIAESVSSIVLADPQGNCKAILGVSYNQLPNDVRLCFLYLGSFPEDKEISVNHLISLWIADGLVQETITDSAEEVAKKYIRDLIAKNLVIPAKNRSLGEVKTFLLHDLLHDFCLDKAKEEHFLTFLDKTNDSQPLQDPRRLIINATPIEGLDFSYQSIRSMICYDEFDVVEIKKGIISCNMVLLEVLEVDKVCSKLFQVLDEDDGWSNSFPDISSLAHLSYLALGLEDWVISSLPSSICKLHDLQTLILRFESMVKVPDLIWDMVKLRHVHISPGASFGVHSNRLENSSFMLEDLRFLSRAQVSCGNSNWLSKLSGLQRLSCVFVEDDQFQMFVEDDQFQMLSDQFQMLGDQSQMLSDQFQILSFNDRLTSLKVENATSREQRFISTCQLPDNLRELTLSYFFLASDDISKIGRAVRHLVFLKIYNCYVPTRYEWNVDDDDFPKLKVLKLRNLSMSKWNASEGSFPSLEQLWLEDCNYLDEIPLDFGYLPELCLISVKKCAPSVDESARKIKKVQHDEQNTRMRVHIHLQKYHFNSNQIDPCSDNDAIVGFHEEARIITEHLLNAVKNLNLISIVGMAGVGKTTLALTLYTTSSRADHFGSLAWCTVSQSYNYREVLLSIVDQVNPFDNSHTRSDIELAGHIRKRLRKRRYLIVLDNLWDIMLWEYLKHYLPDDRNGSRILITTTNRDVADQIGSKVNELHGLSIENSWELFKKKMPEFESLSDDLLEISKEILKNCKGLPLSIVSISETLSDTERTKEKFNEVAENVSSLILSGPQGKIALELSYTELPNHLRSCFLYLGSFPADQDIPMNRLTNLWIAEGFIRDTNSDRAEEEAKKFIGDLMMKSLVIPSKERSGGGVKALRLHNLLRDFCLNKAKEKHFFTVLNHKNHSRPLQDPRRLIINGPRCLDFSCDSIQSMICYDPLESLDVKKGIGYRKMLLLKVLEVREVFSALFPNISSLVHLRYLALLNLQNWINSILPSSISKLQNLQFLILTCSGQVIVPDFIWDMVKLRHIHIREKASFEVDDNRLENSSFLLENLRSLSNALVSCDNTKWLSKLVGLQRLRCVFVEDVMELNDDTYRDDGIEHNQFRMLSFNSQLTSLKVGNAADRMQRFLSTCQLPINLRELTLSEFFLASNDISEIGRALCQLEVLKIYSCYFPSEGKCNEGYEWDVAKDDFPRLKVLKLRDLKISWWNVWKDSFLNLEHVWVEKCDYLRQIPLEFGYLPNLCLISVRECAPTVGKSAKLIKKMQHEQQNVEMRVRIYPGK